MSRGCGVSAGVAGAGDDAAGAEPLWRGSSGGRRGAGRAAGGSRAEAEGLDRGGCPKTAQRRGDKGEAGGGTARQDDDAAGVDSAAIVHGQPRVPDLAAAAPREAARIRAGNAAVAKNMTIPLTDPLRLGSVRRQAA